MTFLLHGMYKREDRVLQTLGLNHGAAVDLHSTLRETSPFQSLVCLTSLPSLTRSSEQDLVKCSRSDFRHTLPAGLSDMAITPGAILR